MKRIFSLLFLSILFVNFLTAQEFQIPKGSQYCYQKKINQSNLTSYNLMSPPPTNAFDVLDYKLDLDIYNCFLSPYPKSFSGTEIITIKADSVLNSIKLHASNSSLAIDGVGLAGVSFTHSSNMLTINLNRQYSPGEVFQVQIKYRHLNVSDGAFYVSGGFVFTDCEPEGARNWFPCWDKPYDKATWNLRAKTPATVKLGSNGRLADSVKIGDTIYYNWISRDPIATYLMVISARVNYNLDIVYWTKPSNDEQIPIRFYYNPGESVTSIKPKVLQMINHYSNLFGEHPFEKNGFATLNSQFSWGGMENQTLTSLCPNCWGENLISHEFAHQWFGDMITCATWADIWLNEGFATYCEALWYEYTSGYSSYKSDINSDASSYLSGNPGWPIYNPQWAVTTPDVNTLFNYAITYAKGACVLHMLRYTLGDSSFFNLLKSYGTDARYKYKAITTQDFVNLVNEVTGQDLSWFFNQWVYSPNHPTYQNTYSISNGGNGNWFVAFTVRQTQTNTVFFKMPITIKVSFSSGPDTLIRVFNSVNNQTFSFRFNRQPVSVVFDPNNDIVLKSATTTQTTTTCREVSVNEGWNIISVPLNSNNYNPFSLFPTASSSAYGYNNGYFVADSLFLGKGYWLKFPAAQSFPVCGNVSAVNYVPVKSGWNMIGVYEKNVNVSSITSNPPDIILTPFYGFDNGYQQVSTLVPGKGYWVKVNQNGNLNFNTVTKSQNAQRNILNGKVIKLIFTDADGYSKELYLAENINMNDYFELPPVPPNSVSDIRFVDNKYVGDLNKENFVQLNSVKFPIKIEIESNEDLKANLTVEDIQSGKIYSLNSSQVIINSKVELLKIKSETLPTSFKVFQNYPNPFNYQTVVRYEIPENGNVQISLFNSLGQKVKVVKYDQVSAGIYSENISFDNLPSGVYFIEVNFNSTVSRIKCLFVK
jgi:aminopeptidase N